MIWNGERFLMAVFVNATEFNMTTALREYDEPERLKD